MKKIIIILVLACIALGGCEPFVYYQVFKVTSPDANWIGEDYSAENEDLLLNYDFWDQGGLMSFSIYNKTQRPIFIDLNRGHVIIDGRSYDYFNGVQTTISNQNNNSVIGKNYFYPRLISTVGISTQQSITYIPKQIVEIPSESFITIEGCNLIKSKFPDCFIRGDKLYEPVMKSFNDSTTPLNFRNYITYDDNPNFSSTKQIDHSFWVSEIDFVRHYTFWGDSYPYRECPDDRPSKTVNVSEMPYQKLNCFYYKVVNKP